MGDIEGQRCFTLQHKVRAHSNVSDGLSLGGGGAV